MKYLIEWETCFCEDDFEDEIGTEYIEADTEEEAIAKAHKKHYHSTVHIIGGTN